MLATLEVPYVDTRAADLVWTLSHPVLPALAMVTVATPGIDGGAVELRVLGASHQVVLRTPHADVVETVACLPGHPASLPGRAEARVGGHRYTFSAHVESIDAAAVATHARRLRELAGGAEADTTPTSVVAAFPSDPDALTALAARTDGVGWDTWHLYPNSRQIVTTSTEVA